MGRCLATALAGSLLVALLPALPAQAAQGSRALSAADAGPGGGHYHPLPPYRLLDTRPGSSLGPGATRDVQVTGTGPPGAGVPASGVGAVVLNVTATNTSDYSYLSVYPTGPGPRSDVSNLNFHPSQTIANLATVAVSAGGGVTVYNAQGRVDVVLDVEGWFGLAGAETGSAGLLNSLAAPTRLLDTRLGQGRLGPNSTLDLPVAGHGGLPAAGVVGVVLNVTAVDGSEASYLTVYPGGGGAAPLASNVNFPAGRTQPNRVMVKLGAGQVRIYNRNGLVDVVVDAAAWFGDGSDASTAGAGFVASPPFRVLDTRPAFQVGSYSQPFAAGETRRIPGPAAGAAIAVFNVTITDPSSGSFLTAFPGDAGLPLASDLNFYPGDVLANLVVVRVGSQASIAIYNKLGAVDVVVDASGWFISGTAPSPPPSPTACLPAVTQPSVAELPRVYLDTAYPTQGGRTTAVRAGDDLQVAIDGAQAGDTLLLDAGASFLGNFELRSRPAPGWVVIRTSAADSALPPQGARLTPAYSPLLPKLISPNPSPAVYAPPGAGGYRLVGVEISVAPSVAFSYELVTLGSAEVTSAAAQPTDVVIDRSYVHGNPAQHVKRGVTFNGNRLAVIDSTVSEIHGLGQDTQAIGGWNGPGPFKIVNDELDAAGENVIFGGADATIPDLVPSDIEFRCNHLYKPVTWRVGDPGYAGYHWSVKNLFELKNARRVLFDGNVLESNWGDAQIGWAILLTVRTGDANPWAAVEDVTLTHNLVRHTASGFEATGHDDNGLGNGRRVLVRGNLFSDVDGQRWGGDGILAGIFSGTDRYQIDHNTALQSGSVVVLDGAPNSNFVYTNNLTPHNAYGVFGSGVGTGTPALQFYCPGYVFAGNLLAGGSAASYPPGNYFPASLADVGFVDLAGGDYHLAPSSPYRGLGTDGRDPGADIDAVNSATRQAVQGY